MKKNIFLGRALLEYRKKEKPKYTYQLLNLMRKYFFGKKDFYLYIENKKKIIV